MAHDVFISYSSNDKAVADAVCAGLEAARVRCWVAPRDVPPGAEWAASIVDALKSSRVMVLVYSRNSHKSEQVHRELTVAADAGVVIVPLKIDDTTLDGLMEYYLANKHWLDAVNPPTEQQVAGLVETVSQVVRSKGGGARGFGQRPAGRVVSRRVAWLLALIGVLSVTAVGVAVWAAVQPNAEGPSPAEQAAAIGPRLGDAEPIGTLSLPGDVSDACLLDDTLYLACGEVGLLVVDVSDPVRPEKVAQIAVANAGAVDAADGYLYVAEGGSSPVGGAGEGRVHVFDVSDPVTPRLAGEYRSEYFASSSTDAIRRVVAHGPYLALGTWQTLELVGISDPLQPRYLWTWTGETNTGITCDAAFIDSAALPGIDEDILALAAGWEGLRFFGLGDPTAPALLSLYSGRDWISDVMMSGNGVMYAAVGSAGLVDFDVSDPASPQPRVIYEVVGYCSEVRQVGEALYFSYFEPQEGHEYGSGIGRVEIAESDGAMKNVRGTEVLLDIGWTSSLEADDEYLYVTVEGLGLFVYVAE